MFLSEISDSKIIPLQSDLFEIPADVTYLNCASMSPQLRSVTAADFVSVASKITPWTIDWFSDSEKLRELAAKIVNSSADSIALLRSCYPNRSKPKVEAFLNEYGNEKPIFRLKSTKDVEDFFMNLESNKVKFF